MSLLLRPKIPASQSLFITAAAAVAGRSHRGGLRQENGDKVGKRRVLRR
jgi:hypothetical protein